MKQLLLILIPLILIGVFVNALSPILLPFVVGIAIAYLTDPVAEKLVKWKINRTVAALIPSAFFVLAFILVTVFALPKLAEDAINFSHKVPGYVKTLETTLLPTVQEKVQPFADVTKEELVEYLYSYSEHIAAATLAIFRKVASSTSAFFDIFTLLLITPVVMFYLIRDWPKIVKSFEKILPKRYQNQKMCGLE